MGYPVAYRPAAAKYGSAGQAFKAPQPIKPPPKPANDNPIPPANDNFLPSGGEPPGGTALSAGLWELLFGAVPIQYVPVIKIAHYSYLMYKYITATIWLPPNWVQHCGPDYTPAPGWTLSGRRYFDAGNANHAGAIVARTDAVLYGSPEAMPDTTPRFCYVERVNEFGGNFYVHVISHYTRTAVGIKPQAWVYDPIRIMTGTQFPELEVSPALDPLLNPLARPVTNPYAPPAVPPYWARPAFARWAFRQGWREVGPQPAARSRTRPQEAKAVRPRAGEKEGKGGSRAFLRLLRFAGTVTEVHDTMSCLHKALPEKRRSKVLGRRINGMTIMPNGDYRDKTGWHKGTEYTRSLRQQRLGRFVNQRPDTMAREIYDGWSYIDWKKFETCALENEAEDRGIGAAQQLAKSQFKPFTPDGSYRGWTPSMMGQ